METFQNCEIFSNFYFSFLRDYKTALRGDNYAMIGSTMKSSTMLTKIIII